VDILQMSEERGTKRSFEGGSSSFNKGNYRGNYNNEGRGGYGRGGYRGRGRGGYNNNNRGYYKKEGSILFCNDQPKLVFGRDPRDEARDAEEDREREYERSDKRRKYDQPVVATNPLDDLETRLKSLIIRIGIFIGLVDLTLIRR
jgi:hypothetical protein